MLEEKGGKKEGIKGWEKIRKPSLFSVKIFRGEKKEIEPSGKRN